MSLMRIDLEIRNKKDFWSGLFFLAAGLFYGITSWITLPMGSAREMGPGYFPFVLSGILTVLGAVIAGRSFVVSAGTPFGSVPWRAIVMISCATVTFALILREFGLFPTVLATCLVASLAEKSGNIVKNILVSSALALFCVFVFSYVVGLTVPIFGSWFLG